MSVRTAIQALPFGGAFFVVYSMVRIAASTQNDSSDGTILPEV